MNKLRLIYASAIGAKLAIFFAVVITIWAESAPGLKAWLKNLTGHHWTSKSYLTLLLYALVFGYVYYTVRNVNASKVSKALNHLMAFAVIGTVALVAYFIWHTYQ